MTSTAQIPPGHEGFERSPNAPVRLAVRLLGKSYDPSVVLENVSFSVESGTSIAFVSPSGSGKSTLLSMVGLLLEPSAGSVEIDGQDAFALHDKERAALRRDKIGFVFQHTQLVGSLRAAENVAMPASFMTQPSFDPLIRSRELLEEFGLGDRLSHYPHQLSIGQKRRVATARALLARPSLVIADEPTNDLDDESAGSVTRALFNHVAQGGILLYATHDKTFAQQADHVMCLEGKTFVEQ